MKIYFAKLLRIQLCFILLQFRRIYQESENQTRPTVRWLCLVSLFPGGPGSIPGGLQGGRCAFPAKVPQKEKNKRKKETRLFIKLLSSSGTVLVPYLRLTEDKPHHQLGWHAYRYLIIQLLGVTIFFCQACNQHQSLILPKWPVFLHLAGPFIDLYILTFECGHGQTWREMGKTKVFFSPIIYFSTFLMSLLIIWLEPVN